MSCVKSSQSLGVPLPRVNEIVRDKTNVLILVGKWSSVVAGSR
jgi:hypothetical protein